MKGGPITIPPTGGSVPPTGGSVALTRLSQSMTVESTCFPGITRLQHTVIPIEGTPRGGISQFPPHVTQSTRGMLHEITL